MARALILFFVLIAIVTTAGWVTGFWQGIGPELFDRDGPGGLNAGFGSSLVTELISFVFQVVVTIFIFQFVAGGHRRRNERRARQDIGDALADIYLDFLTKEPNVQWKALRRSSQKRDVVSKAFYNLLIENSEGLDRTIKSHARKSHEEFDALFFPEDPNMRSAAYAEERSIEFLSHLKKALRALGQTDGMFARNEERIQKLTKVRDAIKSRLSEIDESLVESFETTVENITLSTD